MGWHSSPQLCFTVYSSQAIKLFKTTFDKSSILLVENSYSWKFLLVTAAATDDRNHGNKGEEEGRTMSKIFQNIGLSYILKGTPPYEYDFILRIV